MLHQFPRTFRLGDPLPAAAPRASALAPLTPAAYLQLRRKAAGLSVEQVAAKLARAIGALADDCAMLLRQLETPGVRARFPQTIEALQPIFPIDPDVYRQLATEPKHRHPHVCRSCGSSRWDADDAAGHGLHWAAPGLCTRCEDRRLTPGLRS